MSLEVQRETPVAASQSDLAHVRFLHHGQQGLLGSATRRRAAAPGQAPADMQDCEFGDVRIDFRHHEATKGGQAIVLSAREFMLLAYLVAHRGTVITREQLLDAVWGYDNMPFTRTVDTHIAKLRKKIEDDPANPRYLITLHRLGYKFLG